MKVGTVIRFGSNTYEKRPHGWVDAGCNEVIVDWIIIIHKLLIQGKTAKEIALVVGLSANQVENILRNEMERLNCVNRVQLAGVLAFEIGKQNKHKSLNDYCSSLHLQQN